MLRNFSTNYFGAQSSFVPYGNHSDRILSAFVEQYCWGCKNLSAIVPSEIGFLNMTEKKTTIKDLSMYCEPFAYSLSKLSTNKSQKEQLPDISENLALLLEMVNSFKDVSFTASTKSSRGLHNGASSRRSQYIGVLKNGRRWQVLINVASKKKYIGTYINEKEAAIMHDFYSIVLKGLRAKTNFNYDSAMIKDMISNYQSNNSKFTPCSFVHRL
ncbi:unnamed protein product [Moneuplotes crassus]|uniref:AP2/ERF domain-containing protein n=1 Tax=Euplotes crassus TaxID=5936 RepID=A0AAD1XTZ3_EUPCR|nr:unnamed protein product [Moneuplotes crassus]